MSELITFTNPKFGEIRTVEIDGEPWLVGKDVAAALGYKDTVNALKSHVDHEDKRGWQITTPSGEQKMTIINESGLYSLVLSSKLPGAKKFKRWVTSEVLPSIRRKGAYLTPEAAEQLETLAAAIRDLSERVAELEAEGGRPAQLLAPPEDEQEQVPGVAARKRWMRTMSEKLDLLAARFDMSHNLILHKLYRILEEKYDVVLDEERLRTMEERGLSECSVLTAIFYSAELRAGIQQGIDHNLAPENRGW